MKRAVLSIILGTALPFIYSILSGLLSTLVKDKTIRALLNIPVGWPKFLYFYLIGQHGSGPLVYSEVVVFAVIVASNIFLYTVVTYCVLLLFPSKSMTIEREVPPDPPKFFEN